MPDVIEADEYLILRSDLAESNPLRVPLATPAWRLTSLVPLWLSPEVEHADRQLPEVDGARAYRPWHTSTRIILPGVCSGKKDREGTAYANVRAGLHANFEVLLALTDPPDTVEGTVAAEWVIPGTNKTASIHVLHVTPVKFSPASIRFNLEISIPAGRFR